MKVEDSKTTAAHEAHPVGVKESPVDGEAVSPTSPSIAAASTSDVPQASSSTAPVSAPANLVLPFIKMVADVDTTKGWKMFGTLGYYANPAVKVKATSKVAFFDMDGTIAIPNKEVAPRARSCYP
jgi:hypothetical protein